ncbi:increased DNA methylation 2-like [Arachis stenosperma]|uniref:increased DNA methylation 2-like n=1 Tax=Arachis stenosperma TaxID=217475 RepID=UPI0025ABAEDC|nr:increased DNA methylation 2-like [Arachis stenosperma]XP_057757647.1 increased DNA methylation 2-like [Arachis stenosperma]
MYLVPMDTATQPNQFSQTMVGLGSRNIKCGMPSDDQSFLLYFIMATYFGPDIEGQSPRKSVLQRIAEGLPPYTYDELTGSFMKRVKLERVYYYVLRKADKSLIVTLPFLRRFFEGNISDQGQDGALNYPEFLDLFPLELHPQCRFKSRNKIIENIVFINNPEIFQINPEEIERFKRLSRLEDLYVDIDAAGLHATLGDNVPYNMSVGKSEPNGNMPAIPSCSSSQKERSSDEFSEFQDPMQHVHVVAPISSVPYSGTNLMYSYMAPLQPEHDTDADKIGPAMLFLPSHPTQKEWSDIVAATKNGFALTGSAVTGQVGPIIGLMDIGECEDSYLFRVSLPGVKREEREFSCEVDSDGKVLIRGVTTTGEKTVARYNQVFEMQTHNLCPPGHFSIAFRLPGPVDPHQFSGNFGTDGILEGIVMKGK